LLAGASFFGFGVLGVFGAFGFLAFFAGVDALVVPLWPDWPLGCATVMPVHSANKHTSVAIFFTASPLMNEIIFEIAGWILSPKQPHNGIG
jgi:hypothetical protein